MRKLIFVIIVAQMVISHYTKWEVMGLTIDIPDSDSAGLPTNDSQPSVKIVKNTVLLTVPDEEPRKPPKLPPGNSICKNYSDGEGQSPIALGRPTKWNITKQGSHATKELPKTGQRVAVNMYYGQLRDRFYMENDGFNLVFYLNEKIPTSELTMKVKEWDDEYVFAKGILHWGSLDQFGSEHVVHGRRFPMEIQLIHYKASLGSMENALNSKFGIMIASIIFDISGFPKSYLDPFIRQAAAFAQPGGIKQVHGPLYLAGLFPGTLEHFEYSGSFTTAPCGKTVRRIVFSNFVGIGIAQLLILRNVVRTRNGTSMVDNFRKLQSGNGREIVFNPTYGPLDVQNHESLMKPDHRRHW